MSNIVFEYSFFEYSKSFLSSHLLTDTSLTAGILSVFRHTPTVQVLSVGKEGCTIIGPWGYLNRKLPFIELSLRTADPVPADSR